MNRISRPPRSWRCPASDANTTPPSSRPIMSVLANFSAPSGKCPQKITASAQMLRITLATMLAFSVDS